MLRATVLFLIIGCISAAILRNTGRIVGGEDAEFGEFPFVVSLRIETYHVCGGSILNKDYVLSAAHCHNKLYRPEIYSIQYGVVETSDTENVIQVESFTPHPSYNRSRFSNDIMVVKLESSIPLDGKDIHRVVLPLQDAAAPGDEYGAIVGWGSTHIGGDMQEKLQALDVLFYTDDECSKFANSTIRICAAATEGKKGVCKGDSGGPLTINGRQYGIASSIISACGDTKKPAFYTKVSAYVDWIKDNANL